MVSQQYYVRTSSQRKLLSPVLALGRHLEKHKWGCQVMTKSSYLAKTWWAAAVLLSEGLKVLRVSERRMGDERKLLMVL